MHLPSHIRMTPKKEKKEKDKSNLELCSIFGHHHRSRQKQEDLKQCCNSGKKPTCYDLLAIYVSYPVWWNKFLFSRNGKKKGKGFPDRLDIPYSNCCII